MHNSDLPPWGFHLIEPKARESAPQSPELVPLSNVPAPDASPTTLSPGYIADSEPIEDDFEEEEEESSDDEDEEEHLALADSALPVPDSVPSSEKTEPFETDESAATPPPLISPHTIVSFSQTRLRMVQISIRPHTPPSPSTEAQIPSPPFPLTSPGHRGAIPEADMPPQKGICFTAPSYRFKIRESLVAATARQTGPALARGVDYGFIDTLDASIRATNERVMTALEEVNERVIDLTATHRPEHYMLRSECCRDKGLTMVTD
nr:hypothetical protein [Tanacetum cinerariifolium]